MIDKRMPVCVRARLNIESTGSALIISRLVEHAPLEVMRINIRLSFGSFAVHRGVG